MPLTIEDEDKPLEYSSINLHYGNRTFMLPLLQPDAARWAKHLTYLKQHPGIMRAVIQTLSNFLDQAAAATDNDSPPIGGH